MTELQLTKLFAMDNLPNTRGTDNEVGTGLGLIICRELLENAGSSLRVSSVLGEGTTFVFTVPTDDRLHAEPGHTASDRPAAHHRHAEGASASAIISR
jgi:K+-sensing histidine kinase KdpD